MAIEFFIVPLIGTGDRTDKYRPKYVADAGYPYGTQRYSTRDDCILAIDAPQAGLDTLAAQSDVVRICTVAQLDDELTAGQRNNVEAGLEARQIPAQWLGPEDSWRVVIRTVAHIFQINQRLEGIFCRPFHQKIRTWLEAGHLADIPGSFDFVTGYTPSDPDDPDSPDIPTTQTFTYAAAATQPLRVQAKVLLHYVTYSQLPSAAQQFLLDIRDRQGWTNDELGLTAASTIYEIIRAMGRQGVGIKRRLARHGLSLNSTWAELPSGWQDELREVVIDFNLDPDALGLSGTSTVRQILRAFAVLFETVPVNMNVAIV